MGQLRWGILLLLVVALALLPAIVGSYWTFLIAMILVNAIAAQGLNLVMGYTGQVSLGHAAFVAVGAYTMALCATRLGLPLVLAGGLALVVAAVFGVIVGIPSLKLNPLYLAMVTFGFGQAVMLLSLNLVALTGGPNGLRVKGASVSGDRLLPYYLVLAGAVLVWWVAYRIVYSPYGHALVAVRENETAALAMGIDVRRVKIIAFVLSAVVGAFSGALYAYLSGFVNPDAFAFNVSIAYLTMNVVGGMGTLAGPLIGAVIITVMPQLLGPLAEYQEVISGAILLLFLVGARNGLTGHREGAAG